jgi:type IX secretion system PorP/SprF family membrane protein
MFKSLPCILLIQLATFQLRAQDIHYSQFDFSPLNLNPANTGVFNGDYRFAANQRTQWKSVTVPFSTFSISADAFEPKEKKNTAVGLQVNHDIAGDSRFRTFQFNATGALFLPFKSDSSTKISIGAMLGVSNRNITYDQLYFDEQYNGYSYNPSLDNGENFSRESRTYINMQIGAAYYKQLTKRNFIHAGISLANITKPKQSYYDVTAIKLDRKFNLHATVQYAINDELEIIPSFMGQFQGKYKEVIIGGQARYILLNEKGVYRAVRGGIFYRSKDAGYLSVGIDYDKWQVGISYDINLSDLVPASLHRGGLELAVIYIIDLFNPKMIQRRICPNYI